jgi:hypothetical protein
VATLATDRRPPAHAQAKGLAWSTLADDLPAQIVTDPQRVRQISTIS